MKNEEMKELVKNAYEGYVEMSEDENKIVIDLNGIDEYCRDEEDELDLELVEKINEKLIKEFEENGYEVYRAGGIYAEDGQFKNVNADTAVAIRK